MKTVVEKPQSIGTEEFYSGKFMFFGITLVILGAIAVVVSFATTIGMVMILGGLLVAAAIAEIVHMIQAGRRSKVVFNFLSALLYLIVGCAMLYNPVAGALGLTLIASAFLAMAGVVRIVHGFAHSADVNWGWFVFNGFVDITLAFLIMLGWPASALWVIGMYVGIEMMLYGLTTIGLASSIKALESGGRFPPTPLDAL